MSKAFILGASDPEMAEIEVVARSAGASILYAIDASGRRVAPSTAYAAVGMVDASGRRVADGDIHGDIVAVECGPFGGADRVDHHSEGDPGFGRPPAEYLEASSLGQALHLLGLAPTERQRLVAAADHCLGAAYAGQCPGVDPGELMVWRAESRAAFQRRPVADVLADVEATTAALRAALQVDLRSPAWAAHEYDHDWGRSVCRWCAYDSVWVADMRRDPPWPELPEAATRLGAGYISGPLVGPDGRKKYTCSGSPEQVAAWMDVAERAFNIIDIYGDPARGFAGGYLFEWRR